MGFAVATYAGISICLDDIHIPTRKKELLQEAYKQIEEETSGEGQLSESERYNKKIDIWTKYTDLIGKEVKRELSEEKIKTPDGKEIKFESFNSIYMMLKSGARGSDNQIRQLAAMRGLMSKPSGEIIDTPITSNFREGLSVLEYFISTHGARKGLADTALKTANAGHLTRRLVDVAQHVIITEYDCGTTDGIIMTALEEENREIESLQSRILGRVAFDDVVHPETGEIIVKANEEIDEEKAEKIAKAGISEVKIRSVLTCESIRGACVLCYGRDLARGGLVNIGETIGVIAAQSIGEPGTQLTMRTFHQGGTATRSVEQSNLETKFGGIVKFDEKLKVAEKYDEKTKKNVLIVLFAGNIQIVDKNRVVKSYPVKPGDTLHVRDGERVEPGTIIASWDNYNRLIIANKIPPGEEAIVYYKDIKPNVTMEEKTDELTGTSTKIIIQSSDSKITPRLELRLKDKKETLEPIPLPNNAHLQVEDRQIVRAGDILAKVPKEISKTGDITGGLPYVVELFEARSPKRPAIISEIDGIVKYGKDVKGKRTIEIIPQGPGEPRSYQIPKGEMIIVHEGQHVKAGDPLIQGSEDPHDILKVLGLKEVARHLVNRIQEIYRNQGIKINDKHIEVIVKQMLRQVKITDVGDTNFVIDETVERYILEETNRKVIEKGGQPAQWEHVLQGITKAALNTESFISAASFQETTRVLTNAAVSGKIDYLRGLKENVIMGRLIPAGTGLRVYKDAEIVVDPESIDEKAAVEEEREEIISPIFSSN